jgi:iron complex outermembrane receptor protein
LSGVVGVVWHFRPSLSVIAHSGIAWRPPYVTELFAKGVHHGSATYENGNNSLRPEIAWNSNLSVEWKNDHIEATATIFRNRIRDFIYLNPDNQVVQTVRGAFPSYSYQQSDVVLSGIDASAQIRLFKKWSLTGKYASVSGKRMLQQSSDTQYDWLPLMPGDMLQAGIRYDYQRAKMVEEEGITKKGHRITSFYFNPEWGYFARQYRIPSEGLLKAAPDAYWLVSVESGIKIELGRKELQLGLTARNLTNNRYRDYLNFFRYYADEPGFNIGLRSKIIF